MTTTFAETVTQAQREQFEAEMEQLKQDAAEWKAWMAYCASVQFVPVQVITL